MVEKLTPLYNTLAQIETKGESTILMGDCLKYLKKIIADEQSKPVSNETPVEE